MTDFRGVYEEYFDDVRLFLAALCRNADLAEELTAQTFFKALQKLHTFHGDCDIRTWLCRIGKNEWLTYCRKQRITVPLDELVIPSPQAPVEEQLDDAQEAMRIHKLLHKLPEPYKEVFSLRVFGELSFKQIGEVFGKSQNWACVTYHRARQKIMEALEVQT